LEKFRSQLEQLALPAARIRTSAGDPGLTESKFGGQPFTPAGFEWPFVVEERKKGFFRKSIEAVQRPLTFLAQVNFAEIAVQCPELYELEWGMPSNGLFQVFYDLEAMPWGFAGDDAHWKFIWHKTFDVARHRMVDGPSLPVQSTRMKFSPFLTLPDDA